MISLEVKALIEEVLEISISEDDGLGSMIEWDSMAQLSILLSIEQRFKIKFSLLELKDVTTLRGWIDATNQKINISE